MKTRIINYLKTRKWFISIIKEMIPTKESISKAADGYSHSLEGESTKTFYKRIGFDLGAHWVKNEIINNSNKRID